MRKLASLSAEYLRTSTGKFHKLMKSGRLNKVINAGLFRIEKTPCFFNLNDIYNV